MCFISHQNILLDGICPLFAISRQCMICNYLQYSIGQRLSVYTIVQSANHRPGAPDVFDDRGLAACSAALYPL